MDGQERFNQSIADCVEVAGNLLARSMPAVTADSSDLTARALHPEAIRLVYGLLAVTVLHFADEWLPIGLSAYRAVAEGSRAVLRDAVQQAVGSLASRPTERCVAIARSYEHLVGRRLVCAGGSGQPACFTLEATRDRKRRGAYYTPEGIVRPLVEAALDPLLHRLPSDVPMKGRAASIPFDLLVVDPACGAGVLLLAAVRRIADFLVAERGLGRRDAICAAGQSVYGVDADLLAAEICRVVLWLECGGAIPFRAFEQRIRWGDSLAGPVWSQGQDGRTQAVVDNGPDADLDLQDSGRARPVNWASAFPELAARGGFDVVLSNPPFGNAIEAATRRSARRRGELAARFPGIAVGAYDLSSLFVARSVELLRPGGAYGLVCPRSILSAVSSRALRSFVDAVAPPSMIWSPDDGALFDGAHAYVCIISGRRGQRPNTVQVSRSSDRPRFRDVPALDEASPATWWELVAADPEIGPLSLGDAVPLAQVCQIWAGATAAVAYAVTPEIVDDPAGDGLRFLTTGAIDRYVSHWGETRQRYLGRSYRYPRWPVTSDDPATRRAVERQARPKLLVAGLSRVIEAFLDEGESAGTVSTLVVVPNDDRPEVRLALLAVLTSSLFSYLYVTCYGARQLAGGNCPVGKRELGAIPVPADLPRPLPSVATLPPASTIDWCDASVPGARDALWEQIIAGAAYLHQRGGGLDREAVDARVRALVSAAYGIQPEQHAAIDAWWRRRSERRRRSSTDPCRP